MRRRRKAALPLQFGLGALAIAMLVVLAFARAYLDGNEERTFDFTVGSRRRLNMKCEEPSSGNDMRWDNWFNCDQMRSGGVILNILLMLYMFAGLAIVCDDFFCPALDEICIKLDITDDVAGATFMAAGGSAPEFFTSLLGTLFFESDVGFGTIVGSATFNVLFVIGVCAYFSGFDVLPLTWYPLARDSSYYLICLGTVIAVTNDRRVSWYDALILFVLYIGYVCIMYFDVGLRKMAEKSMRSWRPSKVQPNDGTSGTELKKDAEKGEEEEKKEEEEEAHDGPPQFPDDLKGRIIFLINAPLNYSFWATIPDCRVERMKKYYFITFWVSVGWIGLLSYVMVVMAEDIGDTIGISEEVMGVTVLAVGTSIPDCVSSLLVAREGHGDMALSSSIGSNIFDVTFGLPVPWLIYTGMYRAGQEIIINARGMSIQVGTLMGMVFAVIFSVHLMGWKISKPLGVLYFVLYFVFVTEAVIISLCVIDGVDGCNDD